MQTRTLGRTGIRVSELCLGLLPMGPLQRDLPGEECARIVRAALDAGVTFFDTAKGYRTQPFLREGLGDRTKDVVIATKSPVRDDSGMAADVERALDELGRDYIDIFHLHAAREGDPFSTRRGALERLARLKNEGVIGAVGVATHYISVVREATERDDIDVVFPLTNVTGRGILDGTAGEMASAISDAAEAGLGVYVMKPLAGGNLLGSMSEALAYARGLTGISSVALGIVSLAELAFDLKVFNDEPLTDEDYAETCRAPKRYVILGGCDGCGLCVTECPAEAIEVVDDKAVIDQEKCILCGYCAPVCPGFWIRVV